LSKSPPHSGKKTGLLYKKKQLEVNRFTNFFLKRLVGGRQGTSFVKKKFLGAF
jgi:hypothetical protein